MESRTLSWPTVMSLSLSLPLPAFSRMAKMTWVLVSGFPQLMLSCLLSVHLDRFLCLQQLLQAAGLRLEAFSFFPIMSLSDSFATCFLTVQAIALCCNCLFPVTPERAGSLSLLPNAAHCVFCALHRASYHRTLINRRMKTLFSLKFWAFLLANSENLGFQRCLSCSVSDTYH